MNTSLVRWKFYHVECKSLSAGKEEDGYEMSDLLVVKVKDGINVKDDLMDYLRKEILKQRETGVVVLPWFLDTIVVPEDTEMELQFKTEVEHLYES